MAKGTRMSGPIRAHSAPGVLGRSASVTVSALAAGAEEDLTITDADAAVGDVIAVSFDDAGMETGMSIAGAWVSAAGSIKVRISNLHTSGLTGGSRTIRYVIQR